MKKLLSLIFAITIATPALAMNVSVTVSGQDGEPLIGATVLVEGTSKGAIADENGVAKLSDVPDNGKIKISYMGYEPQTVSAQPTISVKMTQSSTELDDVEVVACGSNPNAGIRTQERDESGNCVPTACYECYKLKNKKCERQEVEGGFFMVVNKQCQLTCLSIRGYVQDPKNSSKCTQDCTSSIPDPNVKEARYRSNANPQNIKCEIVTCNGKYHPSDDKQTCVPDQGACTEAQLTAVHASTGYLITKENKCVPKTCVSEQYRLVGKGDSATCEDQVGKQCNIKHATSAKYEMRDGKLVCIVDSCDTTKGYQPSSDKTSCIRDCLSVAKGTETLAKEAKYNENGECIITKCNKDKDGKKYIPDSTGKKCEVTERDCDKTTDSAIWPEHASQAAYKNGKCTATECESDEYELHKGECRSVNDSDCDKKPENSKKSHRYYDPSTQQTLCLVDECKNGYQPNSDLTQCVLASALSDEDAKKRMEELKANEQAMKERENSTANKLLGAAGIGAVGIGGMQIASALSEQSADKSAEQDMKAYLATFRCDYGQGRNIVGGETNIQLPGASELIQYTTEYKQLAANLKTSKDALGMLPGIESEVVFDSATTGLYDDVGIGTQKGAFTSLSRALLDETGADAAEWQAQKDATAKKLKTGIVVAGVGAIGTLAGNLAINHGKGDKSGEIWNEYEDKKEPIPIELSRIPCSEISGTTGTGYVPNCECRAQNSYFNIKERKCIQCGTNAYVENNACKCNNGYHHQTPDDETSNCVTDSVSTPCTGNHVTGGTYPQCTCDDNENAQYDKDSQHCTCKQNGFDYNSNNKCVQSCNGLPKVKSNGKEIPNCECEYTGAVFDKTNPQNGCKCPTDKPNEDSKTKTCITLPSSDEPIAEFQLNGDEIKFDSNSYHIGNCSDIVSKINAQLINLDDARKRALQATTCLKFESVGHTDTRFFGNHPEKPTATQIATNKQKNQELSEKRATALRKCLEGQFDTLAFDKIQYTDKGVGWDECEDALSKPPVYDKNNDKCRKAVVKIYRCDATGGSSAKSVMNTLTSVISQ